MERVVTGNHQRTLEAGDSRRPRTLEKLSNVDDAKDMPQADAFDLSIATGASE